MTNKPLSANELTEIISGLHRVSKNLWWTWNQEAQEFFCELSPRGWQNLYHNAVAILREVSDAELRARLQAPDLAARARNIITEFDAYMSAKKTWGTQHAPALHNNPVAYFSAEFGFHETLPIAAGGLGILAGDHAKAASDLNIGFVGISLFYREGYFQQTIDANNWQNESYTLLDPKNLPIEPVLDANGAKVTVTVRAGMSDIVLQAWRVNVGRVPVLLLDANRPENEPHSRDLTLRVYGGDNTTRIMQEIVLGVGGVRMLRKLGYAPSTFHMNEGHAAFLTLELIREKQIAGKTFAAAAAATTKECLFTTHTPVEAGHDRFNSELMDYAARKFTQNLKLTHEELMALGRVNPADKSEPFCMTVLALKFSRAANGVSELHGAVSREMWQSLYPGKTVDQVPIGYITNGIHVAGWMKGTARGFWRRKLNSNGEKHDWANDINTPEFWNKLADDKFISDEELWALRYKLRRELLEFSRRRLLLQNQTFKQGDFIAFDQFLNPDALTIGFARRFATYKRAPLIFEQLENIVKLTRDEQRPVQFIFAGKAHPRDDAGKSFIQKIIHLAQHSDLKGNLVFIENYDVHVARQMVSGCDIWLNNPRRPLEASGTSGMKAGCHGCLGLSIMDGWWREGFDGTNGFSIGDDTHPDNIEEQDRRDSANLFKSLTEEVVPTFYNRDANGIPREWIKKIRRAMVTLVPQFSTWRMVQEYTTKFYQPK
jgi:starch phosphorylase